jgi:hypothetical protein
VENHDAKQGDNENQSAGSVLPTVPQEKVTDSNPAKQNNKRVMDIHSDAGYLRYLPRPFHNCSGVKFRGKPDSGLVALQPVIVRQWLRIVRCLWSARNVGNLKGSVRVVIVVREKSEVPMCCVGTDPFTCRRAHNRWGTGN